MPLSIERCYAQLKRVIDPELYQNIVDLGLIYEIRVLPQNSVEVTMTLTTPVCPMGPEIIENVKEELLAAGASDVTVDIVWEPMWTIDAMSPALQQLLGVGDYAEPEPQLFIDPPPPSPRKKGLFQRLFGR